MEAIRTYRITQIKRNIGNPQSNDPSLFSLKRRLIDRKTSSVDSSTNPVRQNPATVACKHEHAEPWTPPHSG